MGVKSLVFTVLVFCEGICISGRGLGAILEFYPPHPSCHVSSFLLIPFPANSSLFCCCNFLTQWESFSLFGLQLSTLWCGKCPQTEIWCECRAYLICFSSLKGHNTILSFTQCLKTVDSWTLLSFLFFTSRGQV